MWATIPSHVCAARREFPCPPALGGVCWVLCVVCLYAVFTGSRGVSPSGGEATLWAELIEGIVPHGDVDGRSGDAVRVKVDVDGFEGKAKVWVVFFRHHCGITEGNKVGLRVRVPAGYVRPRYVR